MQQNCFQQQVTDTAELIPIRWRKINRSNNKNFSQNNRLFHLIKTELFQGNVWKTLMLKHNKVRIQSVIHSRTRQQKYLVWKIQKL